MLSTEASAQPLPDPSRSSPRPRDDDERSLLAAMLADEPWAWREFNQRYSRLIYRCITRVTARFPRAVGTEDVREIYALLCVQLLANDKHKLRSFEPGRGSKLGSWLGMLAIHTAYDHLRRVRREPTRANLNEAEKLPSAVPDPAHECEMRERAELVAELVAGFTARDRRFVELYFGDGLSPDQVAARMGISIKTVYSKKHKIQSRLHALLSERRLAA